MKATMSPWDAIQWWVGCDMDELIIAIQEALPEEERIVFENMGLEWDEENEMLSGHIGDCDFEFDRPDELLDSLIRIEILERTPMEE